jgi:uncharacterized protein
MHQELKKIFELQQFDIKIDGLRAELERIPSQIQGLSDTIAAEKQKLETFKTDMKQSALKHKEKEAELSAKEQEIVKFSQELNSIKTNEAYRAMLNQIENAKKAQGVIEDEILLLLEHADESAKQIKQMELKTRSEETRIQQHIADLRATEEKLRGDLAAVEAERAAFVPAIPPESLAQYEHIRNVKEGVAIVAIVDKSCSGCNYKLPPQRINEVVKGHDLVVCDHCSRILYYMPPAVKTSENH